MADEMADMSNREQVVLCLRWVSAEFDVHEEFIGMYMVEKCNAATVVAVIQDVLRRLNLTMNKVRGQCYCTGFSYRYGTLSFSIAKFHEEFRETD